MKTWRGLLPSASLTAVLGLALSCCGNGMLESGPVMVVEVSGDGQAARAGHPLPEPFVVRVTDHRGVGLANRLVTWTIVAGEGAIGDYFDSLDPSQWDYDGRYCWPDSTMSVRSDEDGFARASFTPTWFGPSMVTASAPEARGAPVTFTADASDPGAVLTIVSENDQEGYAGEWFGLELKVMDGSGRPVPHITITWAVTEGEGILSGCGFTGPERASTTTRTDPHDWDTGTSRIRLRPVAVGTTRAAASVPGVAVSPLTFTVEATVMVINLWYDPWDDLIRFSGPDISLNAVTVPVGATVEFRNLEPAARIVSTSAPQGSDGFDSGDLDENDRFQFVPDLPGTWEFVDQVSGASGTLIVVE